MILSKIATAILLLLPLSVIAQSHYVTDDFQVMMRTGPSIQNKIISTLRSGTPIEVIESDAGNGHSRVQIASGEVGFILARFITSQVPAKNQLASVSARLETLQRNPSDLQVLVADAQEKNQILIEQNVALTDELQTVKSRLEAVEAAAGDAIGLSSKNESLEKEVRELLLQLDDIRIQNEALRDSKETTHWLVGAGIILLGLILGWILSLPKRNSRNAWGS